MTKRNPLKPARRSLFVIISASIVFSVAFIISLDSLYTYHVAKESFIKRLKDSTRASMVSLQKSLGPFMQSFAVNEYEKLIKTELEQSGSFAIIVEDDNMGKIIGKPTYTTGSIYDAQSNIVPYDPSNSVHKKQLENCFYKETQTIQTESKRHLGQITICMSDKALSAQRSEIIYTTLLNAILISLLLVITILFILKRYLLKPISYVVGVLEDTDSTGIPRKTVPEYDIEEMYILAHTINTMLDTIKLSRAELQNINRSLEERIKVKVNELQQKDALIYEQSKRKAVNELLVDLAHHWRQPLNGAALVIQSIEDELEGCEKKAKILDYVDKAYNEIQSLSYTITKLTQYYAADAGEPIDCEEGLAVALNLLSETLQNNGINVEKNVEGKMAAFTGRNVWVEIYSALFMNVKDVMTERHLTKSNVIVSMMQKEGYDLITVEDNVGGIDTNLLPNKLFEAYVTSQFKSRDKGLGLYIVKGIVTHQLQGSIEAVNSHNGALFIIKVPRHL